jgi:autotransporter translocation and assembly factor TamB
MKTILLLALTIALTGVAFADTDVTGKWSGSFNSSGPNGETKETGAVLMLKQNGADITGTVGPTEDDQFPIQKGKIEGDKITLEADHDGHLMTFNLVLASGRITGEAQMSRDGQTMKAKIDVARAK